MIFYVTPYSNIIFRFPQYTAQTELQDVHAKAIVTPKMPCPRTYYVKTAGVSLIAAQTELQQQPYHLQLRYTPIRGATAYGCHVILQRPYGLINQGIKFSMLINIYYLKNKHPALDSVGYIIIVSFLH